jgi:hypothetical protein
VRHDDVGPALAGFDEGHVHGAYVPEVLGDDVVEVAAALFDVARQPPNDAHVVFGLHEDAHVELAAHRVHVQHENALDQDQLRRIDAHRSRLSRRGDEVVDGLLDRLAGLQRLQVRDQQRGVEGVGVIEVGRAPLLERTLAEVAVVRVLIEEGHWPLGERLVKLSRDRRFPRRGATSDADDERSDHFAPGP